VRQKVDHQNINSRLVGLIRQAAQMCDYARMARQCRLPLLLAELQNLMIVPATPAGPIARAGRHNDCSDMHCHSFLNVNRCIAGWAGSENQDGQMNEPTTPRPRVSLPCQEFHAAAEYVVAMRQWIHDVNELGMPHFGELGNRVKCYRKLLAEDFAAEEARGRLSGVGKRRPECWAEIDELRDQHGQFLDELELLQEKLCQDSPPYESWQDAVRHFDELLMEVERHEGRELQLLASISDTAES
jgi:hypothetical protein